MRSSGTIKALIRGAVIVVGVSALCLLTIYLLVLARVLVLPREPLLRAAVYAVPFIAGVFVAIEWYAAGAPWPSTRASARIRRSRHRTSPVARGQGE